MRKTITTKRPSPSMIVALAALFFSMTGAGVAASRYLITSTHQISPAVLKTFHGQRGKPGPQGPQGPAGTQGTPTTPRDQSPAPIPAVTRSVGGSVVSVSPGLTQTGSVACPNLTHAEGGGYDADGMTVVASMPTTNGWTVTVTNQTGGMLQLIPWVICRGNVLTLAASGT